MNAATRRVAAATGALTLVATALLGTVQLTTAAYTDEARAETGALTADVPPVVAAIRQANAVDTTAAIVEGRLYLWGFFGAGANPGGGALGAGEGAVRTPSLFRPLTEVVDVSANAYGYKAIDASGRLWTWGTNGYNENGGLPGAVPASWTPLDTEVRSVASSEYANAWLKADGSVWTTGTPAFGQRGNGNSLPQVNPTRVTFPAGTGALVYVGAAYEGFYAVDDASRVYFWGRDYRGGAGNGLNGDRYVTTPVEVPALTALVASEGLAYLGGGYAFGTLLTEKGDVYTWGSAENNAHGGAPGSWTALDGRDLGAPKLLLTGVEDVAVSFQTGRALMGDGTVQAWGARLWGGAFRLPSGAINSTNALAVVYDGSKGRAVEVGGSKDVGSYTLADGTLWTWGENGFGAACGGLTYAACARSVTSTGATNGLYVWPAHQVEVTP